MNFILGENLGELLLEICQSKIASGDLKEGLKIYSEVLIDFPNDENLILEILKGNLVLLTDPEHTSLILSDNPEKIESNKSKIKDWNLWASNISSYLDDLRDARINIIEQFREGSLGSRNSDITDFNILEITNHNRALSEVFAKLITKKPLTLEEEDIWDELIIEVTDFPKIAHNYEKMIFWAVKYNDLIRDFYKSFLSLAKVYPWLYKNGFIERIPYIEAMANAVMGILMDFSDISNGYYHSTCNVDLANFKMIIAAELKKTDWGKDYENFGIIKVDPHDKYDAGWLSPEGNVYSLFGETKDLIHLTIARKFFESKGEISKMMNRDGVVEIGLNSPERWLEENGWLKIHHDNIYGYFGIEDDEKRPYCPTEEQVNTICTYINENYGGKFYTEYPTFGTRSFHPEPISTYKFRQMDKHMLHKIFSFL